ncbi:MAG TPA: LEA type 2 family protein [Methanoregula sp.]|nr:LEA type 2 family protein [Methanoregula sp.]
MSQSIPRGVFVVFFVFLLTCGCSSEPPLKEPTVTVTDITLADISLRSMTINTTILIDNPNPVGANLNKLAFSMYYLDGTPQYLGHGERYEVDIRENGNTSITIPVTVSNVQALKAIGTLAKEGSITLKVNGSAFIDVAVTEYEMPFEQSREFAASEFDVYFPVSTIASLNVTEGIRTAKDLFSQVTG